MLFLTYEREKSLNEILRKYLFSRYHPCFKHDSSHMTKKITIQDFPKMFVFRLERKHEKYNMVQNQNQNRNYCVYSHQYHEFQNYPRLDKNYDEKLIEVEEIIFFPYKYEYRKYSLYSIIDESMYSGDFGHAIR